ncbi:MAG: 5-(carboxyamino)imidazole ribonucleotide synthase [Actinomycetia bacterium]|nr:5-(carboxyamino)imidazole ribonucleotide synthase [Actinomycetes bacterium]
MMYAASVGLGVQVALLAEGPDACAAQVVPEVRLGDPGDADAVTRFAGQVDVLTFDHEHVPNELLQRLEAGAVTVRPGPAALLHAQDKVVMRRRLASLGVPVPVFEVVSTPEQLVGLAERTGWPCIAKTSRGGYDGKGVWRLEGPDQAGLPFEGLRPGAEVLAEEHVPFVRELSALVVRSPSGQVCAYPVSESVQADGICVETLTPAPGLSEEQAQACQRLALRVADELGVVGVLAVELMQRPDGQVVVNELAMRPHNTGHWSIDGAVTSQFENHLRAVLDLPLGDPSALAPYTVMHNLLGGSRTDLVGGLTQVWARDPGVRVQLYGKTVVPGRKVGHVSVTGDDLGEARARARAAAALLRGDG